MTGAISRRQALALAGAGALAVVRPTVAADDALPKILRVSTFKQTSYLTGYYLQRFAPPGMAIQVSEMQSNSDAIDSLVTGSTDVGYMGVIACLVAASRGRPLKAVASTASRTTRILVRKESPYHSIADLKGKTIGVAKATNQDIIFRELAREAGLNPETDFDYILVPTPSHVEALANRTVEAVTTSEPNGSILLLDGIARELVTDVNHTRVGNPGILVALSSDTIANHPALAQAFVTMHAKTTVWMVHNTDTLVRDFTAMTHQSEAVIKLAMSNTAHHYDIDDRYIQDVVALSSSLEEAHYLSRGYDVRKAFDLSFLPQARAAAGKIG